MRRPLVTALATLALVAGLSSTAMAQDDRSVVILQFGTFDVDQSVMDGFYQELHSAVSAREGLRVGSGGEVSFSDLSLMAGCDTPTPDCLSVLGDFLDGDLVLFGSVQHSADVHMFTLRLFDFQAGAFVGEVVDQTLRGDEAWLERGIPAVIDHLLYGRTASVAVSVEGAPEAEVRLNGERVGQGSVEVVDVAPGEVVVLVMTLEGEEEIQRELVRHNETGQMRFVFEGDAVVDEPIATPRTPREGPSLVPGFVLVGVGVAGIVTGVLGQSQLTAAETQALTLVNNRTFLFEHELEEAQEIQQRMNTANTMRIAGLSVGAVGLAAGGFLIVRVLGSGSDSAVAESGLELDLGATSEGVNAGVRLRF